MSRFFRGGDDSSSESSSEEEELWSGDEEDEQPTQRQGGEDSDKDSDEDDDGSGIDSDDESSSGSELGGANKFLKDAGYESNDSDDEVRHKVKSGSAKRLEELEASIKQIENGQKNGDWTLISLGLWTRRDDR